MVLKPKVGSSEHWKPADALKPADILLVITLSKAGQTVLSLSSERTAFYLNVIFIITFGSIKQTLTQLGTDVKATHLLSPYGLLRTEGRIN